MSFDAIVIGGSYTGLTAATYIARARRSVLVLDGGQPRNRFSDHSHGDWRRTAVRAAAFSQTRASRSRPPLPGLAERNHSGLSDGVIAGVGLRMSLIARESAPAVR